MKLHISHEDPDDIDMTPMIDVIFLLVLFFMIASSFSEGAHAYTVDVPAASRAEVIPLEQARVLTLAADGTVAPKGGDATEAYRDLGELTRALTEYRQTCERQGIAPVVALEADRLATYERVMQVWNAVKSADIHAVSFLVRPRVSGAP